MLTFGMLALLGTFGTLPDIPSIESPALPPAFLAVASPVLRPSFPSSGDPSTGAPDRSAGLGLPAPEERPSILVAARILAKYRDFRNSLRAP